ncbi:MAG TPA: glycosyl transferase [Desulfovibrio sp.]|jgi:glycosyltransferase involved in cell wall biosynthesis|nr:glycosyl transferase [Desulfovibrio sp.]
MTAAHRPEPTREANVPGGEPLLLAPQAPGPREPAQGTLLSVVVPVLHEAHRIAELARHVAALAAHLPGGAVELVVADGAPEADTLAALASWQADAKTDAGTACGAPQRPGVGGISCGPLPVRAVAAPRGRARQMNAGAAVAEGQVLLFLHADTRLPDDAFPAVLRAMGVDVDVDTNVGTGADMVAHRGENTPASGAGPADNAAPATDARSGAFTLSIDAPGAWFRVVEALANLRNRLTRTPYGDQAQFFRAELFRAMGGYPDQPLMEDVEIMRRLRGLGEPLALLPQRVVTSARRWRDEGAVRCTLRNVCLRLLYALGVPAQLLGRWYRARKGAS